MYTFCKNLSLYIKFSVFSIYKSILQLWGQMVNFLLQAIVSCFKFVRVLLGVTQIIHFWGWILFSKLFFYLSSFIFENSNSFHAGTALTTKTTTALKPLAQLGIMLLTIKRTLNFQAHVILGQEIMANLLQSLLPAHIL